MKALSIAALLVSAFAGASVAQAPARMLVPCNYPHGWNSTDASRELRGVPNGMDHQCLVYLRRDGSRIYRDSEY